MQDWQSSVNFAQAGQTTDVAVDNVFRNVDALIRLKAADHNDVGRDSVIVPECSGKFRDLFALPDRALSGANTARILR